MFQVPSSKFIPDAFGILHQSPHACQVPWFYPLKMSVGTNLEHKTWNMEHGTWNLLFLLALMLSACDMVGPEAEGAPEYVVESYQIAGEVLQPVYLSRTAPLEESYDFSELAVSGAEVRVERLNEEGNVVQTYRYRESAGGPRGVYVPEDSATVEPLARYRLTAEIPDADGVVEAQTVVPDTFRITGVNVDTLTYQGDQQLRVRVSRSEYPEREEIYLFTNEALDPQVNRLTPFYRDIAGSDSLGISREFRKNSSTLLNAANYGSTTDQELRMRMPWLMFAFFGANRLSVQAVDDNLYDFIRSQTVQQGGPTTLGPGEIPSILEHVDGGTGVFGSYAQASLEVFLEPRGR